MLKLHHQCLFCVVILLVTACGFQLQTRADLPSEMQHTKLEIQEPDSEFARRLKIYLEQNGVQIVTMPGDAAILEVPLNRMRKEIQSIGDNARVREYLIRHTINFRLLDNNGTELIPLQNIEQSRIYQFNEQDILAAEREEELLRDDLSDSLARMVVRRLGTYGQ
jgi:LPS-assembly lipoprotein